MVRFLASEIFFTIAALRVLGGRRKRRRKPSNFLSAEIRDKWRKKQRASSRRNGLEMWEERIKVANLVKVSSGFHAMPFALNVFFFSRLYEWFLA